MQTKFEHYATTSMLGCEDAPPRRNGELLFAREWEGCAFGVALALSREGCFEWEDFRQRLIVSIAEWENERGLEDPEWDYYQRWLLALERQVFASGLVTEEELDRRTREILEAEAAEADKTGRSDGSRG